MAGVLEQEEIDALMGGLESGELETDAEAMAGQPTSVGTRYDFSKHHYALHRLLPHIRDLHEDYAGAIREKIGRLASSVKEVKVGELIVTDLTELAPRLATPCRIAVISAPPITKPLLLAIESDLVFDIVNRYFGGGNSLRTTRAGEQFSATELKLSQLFVEDLVTELGPAWSDMLDIAPKVESWELDPMHIDALDETEALIAIRFAISFDSTEGGIWLLVPWSGIAPLRDHLKTQEQQTVVADPNWQMAFLEGLKEAQVELVAVLAEQKIKLKHALQLKVGDVIAINEPKFIDLKIGGIKLMRANFGTSDGQMAAKVIETVRTPMDRIKS